MFDDQRIVVEANSLAELKLFAMIIIELEVLFAFNLLQLILHLNIYLLRSHLNNWKSYNFNSFNSLFKDINP